MAIDKLLHDHIDKMDDIEDRAFLDIDKIVDSIDIDALMDDPEAYMLGVGNDIGELIKSQYAQESVELGVNLAEDLNNDIITVQKTNDNTLNEGDFSADSKDQNETD